MPFLLQRIRKRIILDKVKNTGDRFMEYTFFSLTLINIPLVLSEFLCCLMLIGALTRKRPDKKRVASCLYHVQPAPHSSGRFLLPQGTL